jgi:hypothetical protein
MRFYKKTSLGAIIILFWAICLFAQPPDTLWSKTYGGYNQDYAFSIQPTSDGGYIITGLTSSFGAGGDDVYLVKTDANGNAIWTRTFGGPYEDWGRSVKQTKDGGYIIAGWTTSFGAGNRDVYLIKTDGNGNALWTKTFGGTNEERGYFVQQTPEEGYIVVGTTWSFGAGGGDVYLIKTDANGNALWTRTYGGSGYDFCRSIQVTPDSGFVLTGQTSSFGHGGWDVYLIKTNKNGDAIWTRTYGGPDDDLGCSVGLTSDGGYIITGGAKSFGGINWDVYIVKTDSVGNAIWAKLFGGSGEERCHEVQETSDGGYIAFGFTSSFGSGNYDVYLIKTDANGNTLWTKTWGGYAWDMGEGIKGTSDGEYIMCGYTESFGAGGGDFWVIKTKPTTVIEHDVGPLQILCPLDTIYVGSITTPVAVIKNFGLHDESFLVFFMIIGEYVDFRFMSLAAGQTDTIIFDPWFALAGNYNEMVATYLQNDENPNNNVVLEILRVIGIQRNYLGEYPVEMSYNLFKPYPNPTSDNLLVRFSLMQTCYVDMKIYDINGRIVKNLVAETKAPGVYSLNANCTSLRNGVYIIKLKTERFEAIEKFLVTK